MSTVIGLIIGFVVIPIVFLTVFIYLPKSLRTYRLSKLAGKFQLSFDNSMKKMVSTVEAEAGYKRNIIQGSIKGHSIEIFDFLKGQFSPGGGNPPSETYHETTIIVDGKRDKIFTSLTGFAPVYNIRKLLRKVVLSF